jgi:hypothetical protein
VIPPDRSAVPLDLALVGQRTWPRVYPSAPAAIAVRAAARLRPNDRTANAGMFRHAGLTRRNSLAQGAGFHRHDGPRPAGAEVLRSARRPIRRASPPSFPSAVPSANANDQTATRTKYHHGAVPDRAMPSRQVVPPPSKTGVDSMEYIRSRGF